MPSPLILVWSNPDRQPTPPSPPLAKQKRPAPAMTTSLVAEKSAA